MKFFSFYAETFCHVLLSHLMVSLKKVCSKVGHRVHLKRKNPIKKSREEKRMCVCVRIEIIRLEQNRYIYILKNELKTKQHNMLTVCNLDQYMDYIIYDAHTEYRHLNAPFPFVVCLLMLCISTLLEKNKKKTSKASVARCWF